MNNSQNACYQAGQVKGQAQEKGNQVMDNASKAAQSAKESVLQAGQTVQTKAQEAVEAVKNATGIKK